MSTIVYKPDGSVQSDRFICSCTQCIRGEVSSCVAKGTSMRVTEDEDENGDDSDDAENDSEDDDSGDDIESELEENELVQNGQSFEENAVVAIRSSTNANELFYLCQIIDIKQAEDDREDEYGHKLVKGEDYLECVYLELKDPMAKKGYYLYKVTRD